MWLCCETKGKALRWRSLITRWWRGLERGREAGQCDVVEVRYKEFPLNKRLYKMW